MRRGTGDHGGHARGPGPPGGRACVLLGLLPGLVLPTLAALGPGARATCSRPSGRGPAGDRGLADRGAGAGLGGRRRRSVARGAGPRAAPTPAWACGQRVEPALAWTSAGFTKPLRLVLEAVLRPQRELTVRAERGVLQEVGYDAEVPHLFDTLLYEPVTARRCAAPRSCGACSRAACGPTSSTCSGCWSCCWRSFASGCSHERRDGDRRAGSGSRRRAGPRR